MKAGGSNLPIQAVIEVTRSEAERYDNMVRDHLARVERMLIASFSLAATAASLLFVYKQYQLLLALPIFALTGYYVALSTMGEMFALAAHKFYIEEQLSTLMDRELPPHVTQLPTVAWDRAGGYLRRRSVIYILLQAVYVSGVVIVAISSLVAAWYKEPHLRWLVVVDLYIIVALVVGGALGWREVLGMYDTTLKRLRRAGRRGHGDEEEDSQLDSGSLQWAPQALAALVFLLGFGALTVIFLLRKWPGTFPTHVDYRASIVGDGFLLPIIVYVLTRSALALPSRSDGASAMAIGGGVGGVMGALVQAAWWLDPDPHLHWGLTSPHHFTLAGWWHAVFLTVTSGLVLGLWCTILQRLLWWDRSGASATHLGKLAALWLSFGIISFAGLLALDGGPSDSTASTQITLITAFTTLALGVLMLLAVARRAVLKLVTPIAVGTASAVAFCVSLRVWPPTATGATWAVVISMTLGVGSLAYWLKAREAMT